MKKVKVVFLFILIFSGFLLVACQANYIRDVQGGTVAPSSSSERGLKANGTKTYVKNVIY
ncbi:TPA: colicin release lysis protein [Escherichia coli]|uniref:colicin release lysis protein n=1 Tax=Enterobacterales TaxID=91347 RepID=UPI000C7C54C3|nr:MULTISPECIES: colicin release lysis protein [Enterobacteriaceae]PLH85092.1 lysis protein [Klebsiella pneumoniae]